jgi:hypothetical protein
VTRQLNLSAKGLPIVYKIGGVIPAVYMTARITCTESSTSKTITQTVMSNVFGRYLNCGGINTKLTSTPGAWLGRLRRSLARSATAVARR